MKSQIAYRSKWSVSMALLLIFAVVGCTGTGQVNAPTQPPEPSPTAQPASPTSDAATSPTPPSVEPTASSQSGTDQNVLYQDDFTNKATGWPEVDFGDYFIGYHEPEYYHIEIKTAHAKAPVVSIPDPENHAYPDATIELQVFTVSGRTATEGDYRYGLAFRRSGDNYYAFTISPTTKKWEVLKSSPSGQVTLKEGTDENIQGLDVDDLLRVDAQGTSFLFSINGRLVGQVTDSDYSEGEIGLYAENLENSTTHVHFDTLSIREVKFSLMCNITEGGTVNVRTGPSKTYPQIAVLSSGDTVKALGKSPNQWIQIVLEGSDETGWVSYSEGYMSCTPTADLFPVVSP
jgi:SH3 domain-containing protein